MSSWRNQQAALRDAAMNGVFELVGAGAPLSGSVSRADFPPTGLGVAGAGSTYMDTTNMEVYVNEGTSANLYWTPQDYYGAGFLGVYSDFRDGVGKAIADTAAELVLTNGSGVRIFGDDVTQTDSGFTVAQALGGPIGSLITTATSGKLAAMGAFMTNATAAPFKPSVNGVLNIDALVSHSAAITARRFFIGFLGTGAAAMVIPFTGATTTITMVQDDGGGMYFDTGLTTTDRIYAPHNKADEAANIATTATGVDTGITVAAAGTYQRFRVEVSATGVMTCFVDKIQVTQIAAAFTAATGLHGCMLIGSLASATKTLLVRKFGVWTSRGAL